MPLSPREIVDKKFREAFRGYNQDEVDLFLDDVIQEFARIAEENQKMKVRMAALQQEIARFREGKTGTAAPQQSKGAQAPEPTPAVVDAEVRARLRRFFEEQLRALELGPPLSQTAQKIARELPATNAESETEARRSSTGEPFWAGE